MMNTDTLVETTWIKNPDKLHAVRFTEWQQADAIRDLMGADMIRLTVALSKDTEPSLQFFAELFWEGSALAPLKISQGDYLVTDEEVDALGDDGNIERQPDHRTWRIVTAEELQAEHQRYRPIR